MGGEGSPFALDQRGRARRRAERLVETGLFASAAVSVLLTAGIVGVLLVQSSHFFQKVGVAEFLLGRTWAPLFHPPAFGVLPLVAGTVMIVVIAGVIALPVGLGSAIFMSEYAQPWVRSVLKPVLEVLAGIPTIVYGYLALALITPRLQAIDPSVNIFNGLSAGIVVGIMILPMVSSLCEDALRAVPKGLREGAYALGAHSSQVSLSVVVPAAFSGISSAFLLALSRAIGETMAVTIAAGSTPRLTLDPRESIQTLTAYIVSISKGDTPSGTIEYYTLYAVALVLFAITMSMNVLANKIQNRFREVYDN
mgnify:CR=1 FL=1